MKADCPTAFSAYSPFCAGWDGDDGHENDPAVVVGAFILLLTFLAHLLGTSPCSGALHTSFQSSQSHKVETLFDR